MKQMYDNAVVLSDGRHVLRADNGDFMVIRANPDEGADVKLDSDHYAEALAMYNCIRAAGTTQRRGSTQGVRAQRTFRGCSVLTRRRRSGSRAAGADVG